jgi:drug/metabolite transporter (DMT)-like permease
MGELYALACALVWASAVILLKKAGNSVGPFTLNLFRVAFSLPLILATLLISEGTLLHEAPSRDYLILIVSGVVGIAVADTLFHMSLNKIGASLNAIIDAFFPLITVLLAYLMIDEQLAPVDFAGMGLITTSIILSAKPDKRQNRSRRDLMIGIGLAISHLILLSFGVVIIKPVLQSAPVLWVTALRQLAAVVVLITIALFSSRRRQRFAVFKPSAAWRYMVPATVLGSYLALIFWIASMKYTLVGISAILTQSSMIFILIFAAIFLKEPLNRRKVISAVMALSGVLLLTLT